MNLEMKAAENFSYRTRINNIHNIFDITDSPIIKSKVDKNITRVAEQHYLMESLIILNKGLRIYQLQKRISIADAITVMDENWQQFGEFEAVLNIIQVMATMTQY